METIKKFTAIQVHTNRVNDDHLVELSFGSEDGPYYSRNTPEKVHDTEQEAIEYAYKTDKYGDWLILPIISFNWLDEKK